MLVEVKITTDEGTVSLPSGAGASTFSVMDYGSPKASLANTPEQNKAALQATISACDTAGGGVVVVPRAIDYGYTTGTGGVQPDFSGVVNDMMVMDYSNSSAVYGAPAKQGWHTKVWMHTPQTTPPGQHDGNGSRLIADWHPYHWIDVNGAYIPYGSGRTADYNYRASVFFGVGGDPKWQLVQGSQQGNLPDDDLLDFSLIGWKNGAGVLYPMTVKYSDGSAVYGLGTSDPQAAHHFHQPTTANGKVTHKLSNDGSVAVVQIFQKGLQYDTARDVAYVLDDYSFSIEFPNLGNAMQINRSNRAVTFGGAVSKPSGTFDIPHPDPGKTATHRLRHSFVESPTRGDNIYRYAVEVGDDLSATVDLPDYWPHLNEDPQVWVNASTGMGRGFGVVSQDSRSLHITTDASGTYNVLLIGTRKDADACTGWDGKGLEYEV